MAIKLIDGFDHYSIATGVKFFNPSASGAASNVAGRFGGNAIQLDCSSPTNFVSGDLVSGIAISGFNSAAPLTELIIGFAYRNNGTHAGNRAIVQVGSLGPAAEQVSVSLLTDGTLHLTYNGSNLPSTNGAAYGALTANAWHYIEFHVKVGSSVALGDCQIIVGGVTYQTLNAGQSTNPSGSGNVSTIALGFAEYTGYQAGGSVDAGRLDAYDDFYVLSVDSITPSPLGDVTVQTLYPSANGAGDAFNATGVGSNFEAVDEASPDGDSTFVASSTVGSIDLYAIPALSSSDTTVYGTQVNLWARGDGSSSSSTCAVQAALDVGGTLYYGSAVSLCNASYADAITFFPVNPATSAAWTPSAVSATQVGPRVSSSS